MVPEKKLATTTGTFSFFGGQDWPGGMNIYNPASPIPDRSCYSNIINIILQISDLT